MDPTAFVVNGRTYVMPAAPVVVICIDGSEPDYHVEAIEAARMPWLRGVVDGEGSSWPAHCALPALTNPNNLSIATGHPPAVHGISGQLHLRRRERRGSADERQALPARRRSSRASPRPGSTWPS